MEMPGIDTVNSKLMTMGGSQPLARMGTPRACIPTTAAAMSPNAPPEAPMVGTLGESSNAPADPPNTDTKNSAA